eukprot:TRINITY_DN11227_c0_g1_i1.p1 TRINITY_DN11227_c0_g1~~TRINITY_DN11227_c0_g1_i1.p1  ORF type:complete len:159 (+),score=25.68 TRINITY_DN11227_c0_g1_i1:37-477(+)
MAEVGSEATFILSDSSIFAPKQSCHGSFVTHLPKNSRTRMATFIGDIACVAYDTTLAGRRVNAGGYKFNFTLDFPIVAITGLSGNRLVVAHSHAIIIYDIPTHAPPTELALSAAIPIPSTPTALHSCSNDHDTLAIGCVDGSIFMI